MNVQTGNADTGNADQAADFLAGSADAPVYAVVGFDGTAPALRALDAAVRLLTGRSGGLEIVYVTRFPVVAGDLRGMATAEVLESEDEAARDLSDEVRGHLQSAWPERGGAELALPAPGGGGRRAADRGGGRNEPGARRPDTDRHHRGAPRAQDSPCGRFGPACSGTAGQLPGHCRPVAGNPELQWRRRRESNPCTGLCRPLPKPLGHSATKGMPLGHQDPRERTTGFEPATLTLAR